ncbi:MAG: ParB N-terminal domain-containing protein, partial [Planctomycetes bacterium]|nr:ParB N-terminal domain-containing protein [Planctomycetota bacterium]
MTRDLRSPAKSGGYKTIRKRLSSIQPSPENALIYDGIDPDDGDHPDNARLDQSIRAAGLHEPLIVTADGYLVSGHRRYGSLKRIGQVVVPCRVLDLRRDSMTRDEFLALLRDHNRQRYKSVAEQVRETMVDIDPEEALANLRS